MNNKSDGGAAYPSDYSGRGMSLRQWYAGMAMQGLSQGWEISNPDSMVLAFDLIPLLALKLADSMIAHEQTETEAGEV